MFYDKESLEGRLLSTDGKTLEKLGMGGQTIAVWKNDKIVVTAVSDVKSTDTILNYMKKSIPKLNFDKKSWQEFFEEVEVAEKFAGWIAIYRGKELEIKKSEADGIWPAKQLAIKHFKVPKSKQGILAIAPAYEEVELGEAASKYTIYHKTFTSAATHAKDYAEKQGYDLDDGDWNREVTMGGASGRGRPALGKTKKFNIGLEKNGKPQKKRLQFQVFGMPKGSYELNMYIESNVVQTLKRPLDKIKKILEKRNLKERYETQDRFFPKALLDGLKKSIPGVKMYKHEIDTRMFGKVPGLGLKLSGEKDYRILIQYDKSVTDVAKGGVKQIVDIDPETGEKEVTDLSKLDGYNVWINKAEKGKDSWILKKDFRDPSKVVQFLKSKVKRMAKEEVEIEEGANPPKVEKSKYGWQVMVWSPKGKKYIPQGQPHKDEKSATKDARSFEESEIEEDDDKNSKSKKKDKINLKPKMDETMKNYKEFMKEVKEDTDKDTPGTQGDNAEWQKKRKVVLKKYGVASCAFIKDDKTKKQCFQDLDDAHVADHEEQVKKEEVEIDEGFIDDIVDTFKSILRIPKNVALITKSILNGNVKDMESLSSNLSDKQRDKMIKMFSDQLKDGKYKKQGKINIIKLLATLKHDSLKQNEEVDIGTKTKGYENMISRVLGKKSREVKEAVTSGGVEYGEQDWDTQHRIENSYPNLDVNFAEFHEQGLEGPYLWHGETYFFDRKIGSWYSVTAEDFVDDEASKDLSLAYVKDGLYKRQFAS